MNDPLHFRAVRTSFTENDRQALRIKRFLLAVATYGFAVAAAGLGAWLDLWSTKVFFIYSALVIAVNAAFYGVFVSGLNQRMGDPSLTMLQILAGTVLLMFMVYHAGAVRGAVLLWVLLIFMFGVFRLNTRQLSVLAGITWAAHGLTLYIAYHYQPTPFDNGQELFRWFALGGVMTWFTFMGGYISAMRSRMRKSEAFYRTIWETASDAIIIVNDAGDIEYANPAVTTVFGREPGALAGTPVLPLLSPRAREGRDATFQQFMKSCGKSASEWSRMEICFMHAQGHEFSAEVSAAEMQVDSRRAFLFFIRDITARKEAERALVAARTAAEASSAAKTQFLANISHEVRTPMTGIIGMADILLRDSPNPQQRDAIETIHRSGQDLLRLLNDVIDFSRIETGELGIQHNAFELAPAVRDVAKLFETRARDKSLRLSVTLAPELPPVVTGDSTRLRQALTHLLSNAVKFTERGEIEVVVSPAGTDCVRCQVRDTGPGIPPAQQERIFDVFTQGDGSRTRRHGGSGLGLALVRSLVTLMKGETGFESTPGQGSLFWVTLPLPRAGGLSAAATAAPSAPPQFAGKKVLLAEDNAVNAKIGTAMLSARGITVTHAADGEKAVNLFSEQCDAPFDLILMDCQMPVMDGFEAARRIRALEQAGNLRRTPISAFTAHAFAGYREECLASGMDDFITKPKQASTFDTLLASWLATTPAN